MTTPAKWHTPPSYDDRPDVIDDANKMSHEISDNFLSADTLAALQSQISDAMSNAQEYASSEVAALEERVMSFCQIGQLSDSEWAIFPGNYQDNSLRDPYDCVGKIPENTVGANDDFCLVLKDTTRLSIYRKRSGSWVLLNDANVSVLSLFYCRGAKEAGTGKYWFVNSWRTIDFQQVDIGNYYTKSEIDEKYDRKQNSLVGIGAGQNIKTIGGQSIVGVGNIDIAGGVGHPSSYYGVMFGTEADVASGHASAVFSKSTFTSTLLDPGITKIGFYGGGSSRTYKLDSQVDVALKTEKMICQSSGDVALDCTGKSIFTETSTGISNLYFQQIDLLKPVTPSGSKGAVRYASDNRLLTAEDAEDIGAKIRTLTAAVNNAADKANTAAEKVGTVAGNPVTSKTQITNNGAEVKIPWKKIVPSGVTPTVNNFLSIISPAHPSGLVVAEIISGDNYVLTLTPGSDVSQPYSVEVTVFYRSK